MNKLFKIAIFTVLLLLFENVFSEITYQAKKVQSMPLIDGKGDDRQWQDVIEIKLMDIIAKHELFFSAVQDGKSIAIKIRYPDATENTEHKTLVWNKKLQVYEIGSKREDAMVIKWPITMHVKDFRIDSNHPHHADIWYWKSFRTDPLGYADDKYQIYSKAANKKATRLLSKDGSVFFLQRKGDSGTSSYENNLILNHSTDQVAKYQHRQPTGSRADIKAKGYWQNGFWTIEFMRLLDTGHANDVVLSMDKVQALGLSRYEIAGRKPDSSIEIPLFGSGEVGEQIMLSLEQ